MTARTSASAAPSMRAGFDRMDARFDRMDPRFEQMDAKFDAKFDRMDVQLLHLKHFVVVLSYGLSRRASVRELPRN